MFKMSYPSDYDKLDEHYRKWHEDNKDKIGEQWVRPEVYSFASSYNIAEKKNMLFDFFDSIGGDVFMYKETRDKIRQLVIEAMIDKEKLIQAIDKLFVLRDFVKCKCEICNQNEATVTTRHCNDCYNYIIKGEING